MINKPSRAAARQKRHYRLRHNARNKIAGTAEKPRLAVFRSNQHIYAQIIDDSIGHTLVAASTTEKAVKETLKSTSDIEAAKAVGTAVARKALDKGISKVVFDRGGYIYQGKIQALAEASREAGLNF